MEFRMKFEKSISNSQNTPNLLGIIVRGSPNIPKDAGKLYRIPNEVRKYKWIRKNEHGKEFRMILNQNDIGKVFQINEYLEKLSKMFELQWKIPFLKLHVL